MLPFNFSKDFIYVTYYILLNLVSSEYKDILYLQLQKNIYLSLLDLDAYNEANTFVRFKLAQQ